MVLSGGFLCVGWLLNKESGVLVAGKWVLLIGWFDLIENYVLDSMFDHIKFIYKGVMNYKKWKLSLIKNKHKHKHRHLLLNTNLIIFITQSDA